MFLGYSCDNTLTHSMFLSIWTTQSKFLSVYSSYSLNCVERVKVCCPDSHQLTFKDPVGVVQYCYEDNVHLLSCNSVTNQQDTIRNNR